MILPCYSSHLSTSCSLCFYLYVTFAFKVAMETTWAAIQSEIDAQPMPPPRESGCPATVSVHCNDCGLDSPSVPFHFLGSRCSTCGSFNTAISSAASPEEDQLSQEHVRSPEVVQDEEDSSSSSSSSSSAPRSEP